jgi:hypothetical protein
MQGDTGEALSEPLTHRGADADPPAYGSPSAFGDSSLVDGGKVCPSDDTTTFGDSSLVDGSRRRSCEPPPPGPSSRSLVKGRRCGVPGSWGLSVGSSLAEDGARRDSPDANDASEPPALSRRRSRGDGGNCRTASVCSCWRRDTSWAAAGLATGRSQGQSNGHTSRRTGQRAHAQTDRSTRSMRARRQVGDGASAHGWTDAHLDGQFDMRALRARLQTSGTGLAHRQLRHVQTDRSTRSCCSRGLPAVRHWERRRL